MKIIIPMTGMSKRFKEVGIETPKQFLTVCNKMILEHILDMFPDESDINFIISKNDYENKKLQKFVEIIADYNVVTIEYQKSGPGGALLESGLLETDLPVMINYCDFANIWDWKGFKSYVKKNNPDGVIPAYIGLHPHSIYGNDYAFIQNENDKVIKIKEKHSFTDDKMNEFASSGSYYFKSGHVAKKYIQKCFKLEKFVNNEIYISTPFEEMIKDKLDIRLFKIDYFFQWGTPEDYKEFNYNLDEIVNVKSKEKIDLKNINLLIPAAGEGKRFKEKNYKTSKIYLNLIEEPLLIEILNSFKNQLQTNVLILKKDFKPAFFNDKDIKVKKLSRKTAGQAESALQLIKGIDNNQPVLIHSADCVLDKSTFVSIEDADIVVYTKKNYRRAFSQEQNYGWVNLEKEKIKNFSIKSSPLSENSNVIIGTFLFKNKNLFIDLLEETKKIKGDSKEIHVDHMIEIAFINGLKVKQISSEKSSILGTPIEYELFQYMNDVQRYLVSK